MASVAERRRRERRLAATACLAAAFAARLGAACKLAFASAGGGAAAEAPPRRGALALAASAATPALLWPQGARAEYDTSDFALFKADLYTAKNERVKASFGTPWPVERREAGFRAAFNPRRSNNLPGEVAYLEVVPKIGVESVEELTSKKLIDAVFFKPGGQLLEAGSPENVRQSGKATTAAGAGGLLYRTVGGRFTKVGTNGLDVDAHWFLSAVVIGGDLFVYVGTCREATWQKSQNRIVPSVASFRAVPA